VITEICYPWLVLPQVSSGKISLYLSVNLFFKLLSVNKKTLLDKDYELLRKTEMKILSDELLDPEQNYRLFEGLISLKKQVFFLLKIL